MTGDMSMMPGAGLTKATLLRKKNVIGSVQNSNLNYPKDQKFFHGNDIPEKSKNAVAEVKDTFAHHDRQNWNASVSRTKVQVDDNDERILFGIKKGFNDFQPIDPKPNKVYDGCDSRDKYTTWNVSNQQPIQLHKEKMVAEEYAHFANII
jgi:hypothetical protein